MALPQGRCHLCGQQKVLTYEHIPASSSYNTEPVEMFGFEHWLRQGPAGEMTGGELKERGAGVHTLCADCNSLTGGQYVPELKEWTQRGMAVLAQVTKEGQPSGNAVECVFKNVRPALFVKQVVAMLASVNAATLLDHNPELRQYVLRREVIGLPSRYQFYLALTHPKSSVARFAGLSPLLRDGTWSVRWITDLVWPPFGYMMTIDEPAPLFPIGNISAFANRKHSQREDVVIQLPLLVGEHPYPGEFSDPIQPAAEPKAFPTTTSLRLPFELQFASGERREGEISHPTQLSDWTGEELREVIRGLLRLLSVGKDEDYEFVVVRWDGSAVLVEVRSAKGIVRIPQQLIPLSAVREFIGDDEVMPERGECRHSDVLRDAGSEIPTARTHHDRN